MNEPVSLAMNLGSGGAGGSTTPRGTMQRAARPGTPPLELSSTDWQTAQSQGRHLRGASDQALGGLSEQLAQNLAVFPKSAGIIRNQYGVYVPIVVLGQDAEIRHEINRSSRGTVRVTITASAYRQEPSNTVTPIDCSAELRWLIKHRNEYAGQWVALDGDKLIASGPNASLVYEAARESGVALPLVTEVEASDELAFSRQQADATESLEREFKSLAARWRNETTHLSISSEKANNFAYQQIIGMGEQVLPLIFRELETTTSDWFWALRAIARDRAPVIRAEDRGRVRRIAEIWMEWGKQNGYVSG
jgi:hypothetical protein